VHLKGREKVNCSYCYQNAKLRETKPPVVDDLPTSKEKKEKTS
jgi:hypothetical protein